VERKGVLKNSAALVAPSPVCANRVAWRKEFATRSQRFHEVLKNCLCTMQPTTIALTIVLDLGDYYFKQIRLTTPFDESRLRAIHAEARRLAHSLEHVIAFEIGQFYAVQQPSDGGLEPRDEDWVKIENFLEQHPGWEWDALGSERIP
jgi:hypothetical protein